jgi:hypothetical protein
VRLHAVELEPKLLEKSHGWTLTRMVGPCTRVPAWEKIVCEWYQPGSGSSICSLALSLSQCPII